MVHRHVNSSLRQGNAKPLHLNTATFFLKKKELPRAGLEPTRIREREGAMEERGRKGEKEWRNDEKTRVNR